MAEAEKYRPVDVGRNQGFVDPRRSQYPDTTAKKLFLKSPIPELGTAARWKGVRILGAGSRGTVGLWKHVGKETAPPYVAVKTTNLTVDSTNPGSMYFDNEGKWHWILEQAKSQHIVTLFRKPILVAGKDGENVERLLTEYLPIGSLRDLIQRRIQLGKPFTETTLWLTLNCFVDGLSVMAYGKEPIYSLAQRQTKIEKKEGWAEICHFDLHSDNIFLGEYNMSHPFTPVMKQDDEYVDWKLWLGLPELVTKKDFEKWNSPGSTYKSNLWMTGVTMALLATLTQGDVFFRKEEAWDPRLDPRVRHLIPGWRPKGLTQPCGNLASTNYSSALKQIIYEMMYADPDLRPDLQSLKNRVQEGWRIANEVSPKTEPWEDFVHPDPFEAEWDQDTWIPEEEIEVVVTSPGNVNPLSGETIAVPQSVHDGDKNRSAEAMVSRIRGYFARVLYMLRISNASISSETP